MIDLGNLKSCISQFINRADSASLVPQPSLGTSCKLNASARYQGYVTQPSLSATVNKLAAQQLCSSSSPNRFISLASLAKPITLPLLSTNPAITSNLASASTESGPTLLDTFQYGSTPTANNTQLILNNSDKPYIRASLGTLPIVGELATNHLGNMGNSDWQAQVSFAAERNGGLGDSTDGFLAFSKDNGFVRMYNDALTPEQNKKLAALSLQLGFAIEDLPCRTTTSAKTNPDLLASVDEFISKHEAAFEQFLSNPTLGYQVKDGKHLYQAAIDPTSGQLMTAHTKLHGGIRGWCQKNMKWLSPLLGGVSKACAFIPGYGTVISTIATGLNSLGTMCANGKAKLGDLLGSITSMAKNFASTSPS